MHDFYIKSKVICGGRRNIVYAGLVKVGIHLISALFMPTKRNQILRRVSKNIFKRLPIRRSFFVTIFSPTKSRNHLKDFDQMWYCRTAPSCDQPF